ncbi:MAG: cytochrome P450 [Firmicutes bacterium]|nr:cytochrome P450 [Bacillota bacterium]
MYQKNQMPKQSGLDHSAALLREGYLFISQSADDLRTNVFETRLLAQRAYCLRGHQAAALFYDTDKFYRQGVAPLPVRKTLFGEGGVQGLDDAAHRHRKALFMGLFTPDAEAQLSQLMREQLRFNAQGWATEAQIIWYQQAKQVLTQVACKWVGVPLAAEEVETRTEQLSQMYELAGEVGLSHFKGWRARSHAEQWIAGIVRQVRDSSLTVPAHTPLFQFCWHRDLEGELLSDQVVAVEVLNLLRPTVANAVWMAFAASALHQYPQAAATLQHGESHATQRFGQEVRRYYPFFPFTVAKVRHNFSWNEMLFAQDTLTLLDIYGTHHHPDEWHQPHQFNPQRYLSEKTSSFNFLAQGGGDYDQGHRCAGEWVTQIILAQTIDFLRHELDYQLPEQDLSYSFSQIPALPKSRVVMQRVSLK